AACTGTIDNPNAIERPTAGSTGSTGAGGSGPGQIGGGNADPKAAGPRPLARLSRREYNNTVHDLLGDTTHPADQFSDDKEQAFLFRRADLVSAHDADLLRSAAEALASAAAGKVASLVSCNAATGDEACARQFVQTFGLRAFRRPPTATETTHLMALYASGRGELMLDFSSTIGLMIEAMLQSPAFLYHWEKAPDEAPAKEDAVLRLGPYEVASRLSYFLWGSMPDQPLFDAAASGHLSTDAEIEAEATRMLADTKAKESLGAFFAEYLELASLPTQPKDPKIYPEYNPALAAAMAGETAAFAKNVVFEDGGRLSTLLGANYSFLNQALSPIYGASGITSSALQRATLDTTQRTGLLTHPSFLTVTGSTEGSHPVRRGKAVYEKLLCGTLPPPPANVPPAKAASAGGTTRQRFTEHDQNACAKACHGLMDPIGFAFEHYDGIGRYRTTDNGGAVDSTGQITVDDVAKNFADAVELSKILAASRTVQNCFTTQWMRFALGRAETSADDASLDHAAQGFAAHESQVRDLLVAIASSRSFRYRSPADGEVVP
ncbi:MAG TPA: DUF1592 domain-containing protein, partial [Polyangiaceae bacterium]|nr:DUF1592 domain-containing protein [Polyangiaceae bacterium]